MRFDPLENADYRSGKRNNVSCNSLPAKMLNGRHVYAGRVQTLHLVVDIDFGTHIRATVSDFLIDIKVKGNI
jgi:hypothetical protein